MYGPNTLDDAIFSILQVKAEMIGISINGQNNPQIKKSTGP